MYKPSVYKVKTHIWSLLLELVYLQGTCKLVELTEASPETGNADQYVQHAILEVEKGVIGA
jgi:uncharacterized membrane protein (UPF0127 family)